MSINALGFGEDGLLIFASDGPLVSSVTRQAATIPVEYRVRALRPRQSEDWPAIPLEVDVEGEHVTLSAVDRLEGGTTNTWFRVAAERTLPRNAIRALFDAAGLKVSRTMLVKWGPVTLPRDLPRGRSRELAGEELDALLAAWWRDSVVGAREAIEDGAGSAWLGSREVGSCPALISRAFSARRHRTFICQT